MRILFISTSCSEEKYKQVYEIRSKKLIEPQQKFCKLLIEGMSVVDDVIVDCLSAVPVSASTVSQKVFPEEKEIISSELSYTYLPFRNGRIMRYVSLYRNSKKAVKKWVEGYPNEKKVIICDALSYFITRPSQIVAKKYGIKNIGIVTDLPLLTTSMKERKESVIKRIGLNLFQRLTNKSLNDYDAYIPLTKSIDDYINKHNKPMFIIEGSVDGNKAKNTTIPAKKKVMLYAGGIFEKYGLKSLVDSFIEADTNGYELHIYGEGSYVEELKKVEEKCPKVKYKGMVSLEEIVEREKEAMILVNPRPCNEEFSKYSFPSKTLEYMSTGTPLLTTKLPGIPDEYFEYVYSFERDNLPGIRKGIEYVVSIEDDELISKGKKAKDYVMGNKSNYEQGKLIVRFVRCLI